MRSLTIILSVFILLSFTLPALSAEKELSNFDKSQRGHDGNNDDPSRDLGPDWIVYDDDEGGGLIVGPTYWSKVTFTPEEPFQLQGFSFTPLNQGPNEVDACRVRIYSEDAEHNLVELLFEVIFAQVPPFGQNAELIFEFDEDEFIDFEAGENFTIMYESPGGNANNDEGNNGWWNLYDGANNADRSFYCVIEAFGDDPLEVHDDWEALNGDLLLRANGEFNPPRDLNVAFRAGWNMISINVFPPEEMWAEDEERGPDIILMTEQLVRENGQRNLEIVKDDRGRFYIPEWGFCNIPYWNLTRGYMLKVDEAAETVWSGIPIPFDMDIPMEEGWHTISYLPTYELNASAPDFYVLSPIIEDVFIACDWAGRFMAPEFNFSNMIPWTEGQGYQIKVNNDVVLNYPIEREEEFAQRGNQQNQHWNIAPTGENMNLLITSVNGIEVKSGDQIGAFDSSGNMVGVGNVESDGRCGLAVWGDDGMTELRNGLFESESFSLKLWSSEYKTETDIEVATIVEGLGLIYETNEFGVLSTKGEPPIPNQYSLSHSYPNPFNSTTKLSFAVPTYGQISITVSDITGRHIQTLINREINAGNHITTWNAESNSTGVYVVRMEAQGFEAVRKILLVK